jgi:hypothetical protein
MAMTALWQSSAALLWLVRTWRPWLATALAVLVSADAALTSTQALVWNLPRARNAGELAVIALAVVAPALAAALLWLARAHRSLWR